MEAVVNVDGNGCGGVAEDDDDADDNDDDDGDVSGGGGEAADAVCLDVVWTASKPERWSLVASSGAELLLLCWPTPPSASPLSSPPLPCL